MKHSIRKHEALPSRLVSSLTGTADYGANIRETPKDYIARHRIAATAVTAALTGVLALGVVASLPQKTSAEGVRFPNGNYLYANRDSSSSVSNYVDVNATPCDANGETDVNKADRSTYGFFYTVKVQFNKSHSKWWGRPFWWMAIPQGVELVQEKSDAPGNILWEKEGGTRLGFTPDEWGKNAPKSRFFFEKGRSGHDFKGEWERMTGENFAYNQSGGTLDVSRVYGADMKQLFVNWDTAGSHAQSFTFRVKLKEKGHPVRFVAGVYQLMGNWHYTNGVCVMPPTLPGYSAVDELEYPERREVKTYGQLTEDERKQILHDLWEKNKDNTELLSHLGSDTVAEVTNEDEFGQVVAVQEDGSATVSYKDGSKDTIAKENLTKRYIPLAERTQITYPEPTLVKKPQALSKDEKKQVEDAIKKANENKEIEKVEVAENGDATITFKDKFEPHSTKKIEGKYLVRRKSSLASEITPLYGLPTGVKKLDSLTPDEQQAVKEAIWKENQSNNAFTDAIKDGKEGISVDAQGNATITYKDHEADYPSQDTISKHLLVYQIAPLADRLEPTIPARMGVKDASQLEEAEIQEVEKRVKDTNTALASHLKEGDDAISVAKDGTTTITYKDGSKDTIRGERLVYTKSAGIVSSTEKKETANYTYFITPIKVNNKNNISNVEWADAARRFVFDNYEWQGKPATFAEAKEQEILKAGGGQIAAGQKWELSNPATGIPMLSPKGETLGIAIGYPQRLGGTGRGIEHVIHGDNPKLEFHGTTVSEFIAKERFTISKDDLFYEDAGAFNPEKEKEKIGDEIDKALKEKGFTDDEREKIKKKIEEDPDLKNKKDNLTKPEDVDKLLGDIDKKISDEKKKKDKEKQLDDAGKDLGLTDDDKNKLKEKIGDETDPDKIREKINELQKEKDKKKQEDDNKKKQQEDASEDATRKEQQKKDDKKIEDDTKKHTQDDQQDNTAADEAKKKADLEKKKEEAKKIIDGLENISPEDKIKAKKEIDDADDTNKVQQIVDETKRKDEEEKKKLQNAKDEELRRAKEEAKRKIDTELTNLTSEQKSKYKKEIDEQGTTGDVWKKYAEAELENGKIEGKKKIEDLKNNGELTDDEARDYTKKIDDATSEREIDALVSEAETKKMKSDAKKILGDLKHINNAQRKEAEDEIDDLVIDPSNPERKDKAKIQEQINRIVQETERLDGQMKNLDDTKKVVDKKLDSLKQTDAYRNDPTKKEAFDKAYEQAGKILDKEHGPAAGEQDVEQAKTNLENAVKALGGDTIDRDALEKEVKTSEALKGKPAEGTNPAIPANPAYLNASPDKKQAFERALEEAKQILKATGISQEAVDGATQTLKAAREALDGHDKSALKDILDKAGEKKTQAGYIGADADKKKAFDDALKKATDIFNKAGATEEEINSAKQQLEEAMNNLNGRVNAPAEKTLVFDAHNLTQQDMNSIKSKVAEANTALGTTPADVGVTQNSGETSVKHQGRELGKLRADEVLEERNSTNTKVKAPQEKLPSDGSKLTPEQKEKLKKAVVDANTDIALPENNVRVDDNGNVEITFKDGSKQILKSGSLLDVRTEDENAPVTMYRLYNPYTGEHLFTVDYREVETLTPLGWNYEGAIGKVALHGEKGGVYRLYNPFTGEHHFTMSEDEVKACVAQGWRNEGIKFFSANDPNVVLKGMVSMYNPYEKAFYHHYTSDAQEIATMQKAGWKREDIKWYVM